ERSVGEVAPWSRMQLSKAASDRPVSADACFRCPTIATTRITITAIGTNVPKTIAAVEIFLGGFGGGCGHHAGSEKSLPTAPILTRPAAGRGGGPWTMAE